MHSHVCIFHMCRRVAGGERGWKEGGGEGGKGGKGGGGVDCNVFQGQKTDRKHVQ